MKPRTILFLFLILALTLSACRSKTTLNSNREKWDSQGITHYRFDLTIACFCPFYDVVPVTVEVKDGEIVSMTDVTGQPLKDEFRGVFENAATIESLFAIAEENIVNADKVSITYDSMYGFPTSIIVDRIVRAMDDEISYYAENFEVLK